MTSFYDPPLSVSTLAKPAMELTITCALAVGTGLTTHSTWCSTPIWLRRAAQPASLAIHPTGIQKRIAKSVTWAAELAETMVKWATCQSALTAPTITHSEFRWRTFARRNATQFSSSLLPSRAVLVSLHVWDVSGQKLIARVAHLSLTRRPSSMKTNA